MRLGDHFNNLAGLYKAAQIAVHSVKEINQGLLGYGSSAKPNDLHVRYWSISILIFYQRRSEVYEILSCLILRSVKLPRAVSQIVSIGVGIEGKAMRGFMFGKSHVHGFQLKHPRYAPASMLIDPLVIGELQTVLGGPVAFSRRPVAYATGSPTRRSRSVVL
ncbi:hypothetical protein QBD01_000854 [Ochrobactrum sp. 19YEA23]|nr:hypothetical protein [Ochrobactrum sp. 19YEA23]